MSATITKVGLIGDLHLDDRVVGKHKNYYANCIQICDSITKAIETEQLSHLILTGDLFCASSYAHTLKTHEGRLKFFSYFALWNKMTNGHVYSLKGNHDMSGATTDFDVLLASGLIKCPKQVLIGNYNFHFLNYGDEESSLQIPQQTNIVQVAVVHKYYTIEGKTDFIPYHPGGVELSSVTDFANCDIVVAGHIHNPSNGYLSTSITGSALNSKAVNLIYLGCPTRPRLEKDLWDKTLLLVLQTSPNTNTGMADMQEKAVSFALRPREEIFEESITAAEEDETSPVVTDMAQLEAVMRMLIEYKLIGDDMYTSLLEKARGLDKPAADLAEQYLNKAMNINK